MLDNQILLTQSELKAMFMEFLAEYLHQEKATYLQPEDVMGMLNVSRTTLWRWEQRGYLVPSRIGGKVLYKASQVEDLRK